MFYEMRRKDCSISDEKTVDIFTKSEFGVLSSTDENGYLYGIPLNYVLIDNKIHFHCFIESGHKIDNFKYNNKVSFCVVGSSEVITNQFATKYESAIAFGKICEVFGEEKISALRALIEKYSPGYSEKGEKYIKNDKQNTGVYKIEIEHFTGKSNI